MKAIKMPVSEFYSTNARPCPMAKHIEMWPIEKLIPYARNPRTHSEAQVAQIAAINNPILVDTKAGIIAGHGRLLAARKLQLQEVPVIVLDHLTEAQKLGHALDRELNGAHREGADVEPDRTRHQEPFLLR